MDMNVYFGYTQVNGIVCLKPYRCWIEYLDLTNNTRFSTVLFEAPDRVEAMNIIMKKHAHFKRQAAKAIELDYWVTTVRGADI